MSRFEVASRVLGTSSENFRAAESLITDVDVAEESAALTRGNILQKAGAAVLRRPTSSRPWHSPSSVVSAHDNAPLRTLLITPAEGLFPSSHSVKTRSGSSTSPERSMGRAIGMCGGWWGQRAAPNRPIDGRCGTTSILRSTGAVRTHSRGRPTRPRLASRRLANDCLTSRPLADRWRGDRMEARRVPGTRSRANATTRIPPRGARRPVRPDAARSHRAAGAGGDRRYG